MTHIIDMYQAQILHIPLTLQAKLVGVISMASLAQSFKYEGVLQYNISGNEKLIMRLYLAEAVHTITLIRYIGLLYIILIHPV